MKPIIVDLNKKIFLEKLLIYFSMQMKKYK